MNFFIQLFFVKCEFKDELKINQGKILITSSLLFLNNLPLAIFLKGCDQVLSDHSRRAAFNMMAFNKMNQFSVFK